MVDSWFQKGRIYWLKHFFEFPAEKLFELQARDDFIHFNKFLSEKRGRMFELIQRIDFLLNIAKHFSTSLDKYLDGFLSPIISFVELWQQIELQYFMMAIYHIDIELFKEEFVSSIGQRLIRFLCSEEPLLKYARSFNKLLKQLFFVHHTNSLVFNLYCFPFFEGVHKTPIKIKNFLFIFFCE